MAQENRDRQQSPQRTGQTTDGVQPGQRETGKGTGDEDRERREQRAPRQPRTAK